MFGHNPMFSSPFYLILVVWALLCSLKSPLLFLRAIASLLSKGKQYHMFNVCLALEESDFCEVKFYLLGSESGLWHTVKKNLSSSPSAKIWINIASQQFCSGQIWSLPDQTTGSVMELSSFLIMIALLHPQLVIKYEAFYLEEVDLSTKAHVKV